MFQQIASTSRAKTIQMVCAALLVLSFFISTYGHQSQFIIALRTGGAVWWPKLYFLVPIFGLLTLVMGLIGKRTRVIGLIAGATSIMGFAFLIIRSALVFHRITLPLLNCGWWLSGIAGVGMLVTSLFSDKEENGPGFRSIWESLIDLLQGSPPVSTSIYDAVYEDASLDDFIPEKFAPLAEMPRTAEGGFFLQPGVYQFMARSYCLQTGAYAPIVDGPGYIYAPLKGSKSEIIRRILQRSCNHPEIAQEAIQVLLWAILARAKISNMNPAMRDAIAKLLTPGELFELNGGALGLIPERITQIISGALPEPIRRALETEQRLREMFTETIPSTYEEIQKHAMQIGIAPPEEFVREIPAGRWSKHPDGYHIRFFPSASGNDYSTTRIELFVQESALSSGGGHGHFGVFDASTVVAQPASNHGPQREGQSGVGVKSTDAPSTIDKARGATVWLSIIYKICEMVGMGALTGNLWHALEPLKDIFPHVGLEGGLEAILDLWEKSSGAIAGDPPRSDYTTYEKPVTIQMPLVQPSQHLSAARAAAFNRLLSETLRTVSFLQAGVVTQDRLGGALEAKDPFWAPEQARVLCHCKREAGLAMIGSAEALQQFLHISQEDGFEDVWIAASIIQAFQDHLRQYGYPSEFLASAQILGLSADEIESIRQLSLAASPEELEGMFYSISETAVESITAGGTHWASLPEVNPDWL